ncbi:DUF1549 domain-containing protein [Schlesneria paludicola]|uniref:DUF1549 domain-containing protein n=1 Tax=Schlesneria paludicola TaxID=360056 RepID=UPI00029ABCE7|nr:DUF1549 domain-containing protein [Schlesneria paludicola]
MNARQETPSELETLLEALCEDRITAEQASRLEQLVVSSEAARWKYLQYLDLHGNLYWDAAGVGSSQPLSFERNETLIGGTGLNSPAASRRRNVGVALAGCVLLAVIVAFQFGDRRSGRVPIATIEQDELKQRPLRSDRPKPPREYGPAITLSHIEPPPGAPTREVPESRAGETESPDFLYSDSDVVATIDHEIQEGWTALGISASAPADDPEWCRRLYLDLLGRVPTLREVETFLADRGSRKKSILIDRLITDTACVRNLTTKFTNLLIGRVSNPLVDRAAFQKFLRTSFADNRPWNQIVADLISAEGTSDKNGATNFLIAHLNNDATPATAVASRVFLGQQLHCNQCHNNPFDESKQSDFWELNSFFQQTTMRTYPLVVGEAGNSARRVTELVSHETSGPTYYETTNGLMRVAYPRFHGHDVDPGPDSNRRLELARLMTAGDQPELAGAFVNRMWEHFFGMGFTYRADDLGPHQPTSHPELLKFLSGQFIRSGYDIKQLMRWICLSNPYQLTSRFSAANRSDEPARGELPAFSRMYVKAMTAEQAYDSFLTATKAHQVGAVDWTQSEQHRQEWLQQFVVCFHTDDNDETMSFDGSVGNALSLMNGPLISKAMDVSSGSFLSDVLRRHSTENDKIRSLWLAVLSRPPTANELATAKKLLRAAGAQQVANQKATEVYQDLLWALLNSNEFIAVR